LTIGRVAEPVDREGIHAHRPDQRCRKGCRYGDTQAGRLSCWPRYGLLPAFQRTAAAQERPEMAAGVQINPVVGPAPRWAEHPVREHEFRFVPPGCRDQNESTFWNGGGQLLHDFVRNMGILRPSVPLVAKSNLDFPPPFGL